MGDELFYCITKIERYEHMYNSVVNDILKINSHILSLITDAKTIPGISENSFRDWEETCGRIQRHISDDIIRIAVVGPIKSGKSTFINSLFKGDYLKRGAGVVTSIVTRARSGDSLNASLFFKSCDEINTEIESALVLFPSIPWDSENTKFDIRREKDREGLRGAIQTLSTEQLISNDTRNMNSVLLMSYVRGYDKVHSLISQQTGMKQYTGDVFREHWDFVGNDHLAVYLKDIQLEINSSHIDKKIEIADCQGSDSPNPLHLVMIQNYLLLTHLIVYVISSRTGLRRADIRFLSMIKKMGIMDNILFVINCDFSEHESIEDLQLLIQKVREELSFIKPKPEVYSFSALYNLFKVQREDSTLKKLPEKDLARAEQWENEKGFSSFSDQETALFESSLKEKITRERYSLLLRNHFCRLAVMGSEFMNWININKDILKKDTTAVNDIYKKIKHHQEKMNRIKNMIQSTLDGAVQTIRRDLKNDVDRFFDARSGELIDNIIEFIRSYQTSFDQYEDRFAAGGFSNILYLIYQEFKQALDFYMAETITPKIIGFIKKEEEKINSHLETVAGSYEFIVKDALFEYKDSMGEHGIELNYENHDGLKIPDMESIKGTSGLRLPPPVDILQYTALIRTEAILRLGMYTVIRVVKKLFKRSVPNEKDEKVLALKDAVLRIKRETEKSIGFQFKSYKENIKFQYIFKLVDAFSTNLYEILLDRFQVHVSDLSKVVELFSEKRIDKEQVSGTLKKMEISLSEIHENIERVKKDIESIV